MSNYYTKEKTVKGHSQTYYINDGKGGKRPVRKRKSKYTRNQRYRKYNPILMEKALEQFEKRSEKAKAIDRSKTSNTLLDEPNEYWGENIDKVDVKNIDTKKGESRYWEVETPLSREDYNLAIIGQKSPILYEEYLIKHKEMELSKLRSIPLSKDPNINQKIREKVGEITKLEKTNEMQIKFKERHIKQLKRNIEQGSPKEKAYWEGELKRVENELKRLKLEVKMTPEQLKRLKVHYGMGPGTTKHEQKGEDWEREWEKAKKIQEEYEKAETYKRALDNIRDLKEKEIAKCKKAEREAEELQKRIIYNEEMARFYTQKGNKMKAKKCEEKIESYKRGIDAYGKMHRDARKNIGYLEKQAKEHIKSSK